MGSNVSEFQDSIGKGTVDLQVAFSPVIVVMLIIAAVVFAVMALVPMKLQVPGDNPPPSSNFPCGPGNTQPCLNPQEVCDNGYCHRVVGPPNPNPPDNNTTAKTHPMLLIGTAVCLGLALVVVPLSRKMQQIVYSNKNASIAAGTFTEADILGNLLRGR